MRLALALTVLVLAGCARYRSGDSEYNAARQLLQSEHLEPALAKANDGLRHAARDPDPRSAWRFRLLVAEILLAERQASRALAVLSTDPPDQPEWAEYRGRTFLYRGFAAYLEAHYSDAQAWIERAANEARRAGSASLPSEVQLRRGLLLVSQSRLEDAETLFRQVIRDASERHDTGMEALATGNLGYTLLHASMYDEAIIWFERARALHKQLGANESAARDDGNIGWCYFRLGDFDTARGLFQNAETAFGKTGNRLEQQIWLGNLANVSMMTRDFSTATAGYRQAVAIARQMPSDLWVSNWLVDLAQAEIELGDFDKAEAANNEASRLERRIAGARSPIYSLYNSARIAAARKQFGDAEELYRNALREPANDPTVILDTHADLANLYRETGRDRQAQGEFEIAVASITRLSSALLKEEYKFSYLDSLIRFYREYVDFLMARGDARRALEVAESSRSQVLAHRSGQTEAVKPQTAAGYEQLARGSNAVFLEYWLGDQRSYLWVITAKGIRHYELPPAASIRALVENYRAVIMAQREPLAVAAETGRKLYDTLLAPARQDLCQGCRVTIVSDGDLNALNFESLPAVGEDGKYLVEQLTLAIAPSLDYLLGGARAHGVEHGMGLLVIGDPAPALAEYPKLEYAAREIDSITSAMRGSQSKVLQGADARPASYSEAQPGRFGLIHFSAHATANLQSPLDSAVILSGPPERCRLFARDVMSVPLTAELVTISACRSAGAKTYAGEGLVGFAWAFLRAGAHNVIAGMWDVNDRSTAQLMARLYEEIQRGAPPADALRSSKLALIHAGGAYAKPFYWAPFQVYTGTLK
jgi:CHAT domain-containing protein/Tfp pilus assembly protein PilF